MSSSANPSMPSIARLAALRAAKFVWNNGALIFFLLLIGVVACRTRNFLSFGTMEDTLFQAFPVILVALGMTMVMSSGGIDISVGSIVAICAAVSGRLYLAGAGLVPSIAAGVLAGGLCGLFNGILISRFRIQSIIVTLVTMIAGRGLAQTIVGKPLISFPMFSSFDTLGLYRVGGIIPIQIVIVAAAVPVMLFVAKKTVFAKRVEAIGENARAARLVGINVVFTTTCVYVLCGVLCSIVGIMLVAQGRGGSAAAWGLGIELDAIAAVAIGGTSFSGGKARILGTVFGAVVISLVTIVAKMNHIPVEQAMVFKAVMVIAVLWVKRDE